MVDENKMYVIAKKYMNNLKKGNKYQVVNADAYEYEIVCEDGIKLWIDKGDIKNFDYHV